MSKTAVVTGASSGIGEACSKLLIAHGYRVYGLSRHSGKLEGCVYVTADVSDDAQVCAAFDRISAECNGSIDLLVNNAGYGISGATECTDIEDAKKLFDVNFFGQARCCKAALPLLRASKGRIINISSAAALFSIPFQSYYSAGKSAVNAYSLALDNELRIFGVRSLAIMPGDVKTGFTDSRIKNDSDAALYGDSVSRSVGVMESDERNGMSPDTIAKAVLKAANERNPKPLRTVGASYSLFALLFKLLPIRLVNYLVGKIYIKKR